LRLRDTGALLLRAPRGALFAAARVPVAFDRLFAAAPEPRFEMLAERLGAVFADRLEAALLERLETAFVVRLEAAFVPPRAPLRAAVFAPEPDFRVVALRLDPDTVFEPETRVVRFVPPDLVAPRALVFAAVRFVPEVEREAAVLVPLRREPEDLAAVLRDPEADFVDVRRELEAVLVRALLFPPDALLRAVEDLRAVLFFCPESLFAEAARLREPEAPRRALPLRAVVPALFVERRFAVEPLLPPDALLPPRERFATNLKKRLVPPDST
jgi:hypothetical protein